MYLNYLRLTIKRRGSDVAIASIKFNPLNFKTKTTITLKNGREYLLTDDYMPDEQLKSNIENFVDEKVELWHL